MGDDRNRRAFLRQAAGLAGSLPLAAVALAEAPAAVQPDAEAAPAPKAPPATYHSLAPDEAAFIEAMVNVMCPADALTPNGVDCGLAIGIDRQLASAWGKGSGRYLRGPFRQGKPQHGSQSPLTPEQLCKAGIAAARAACVRAHGREFADLPPELADAFLAGLQSGAIADEQFALAAWFNELVYPVFLRACFADPMYDGNRGKAFWKMIGYPGQPAAYGIDFVRYRGKRHPGSDDPKSIADLS